MQRILLNGLAALTLALGPVAARAQHHDHGAASAAPATLGASAAVADWTPAELRKLDLAALKVTLKHGEIRNLAMPPMTMVFHVRDAAQLEGLKVGDPVRFRAERREGGGFVVVEIQKAD